MCGVLGGFFDESNKVISKNFIQALDKLTHRGPDDTGYISINLFEKELILGHTRLSILDLSKNGHQPMTSYDGNLVISLNGEIYNYKELREDLEKENYTFNTDTDTEVLLHAFHHWGLSCLKKLTGMFAFCVYDKKKKKLTIARDAFGIKPLFYLYKDGLFLFSSEINPILKIHNEKVHPDLKTIYSYLEYGLYDDTERTFFKDIKNLRPASYIELDLKHMVSPIPKKWWKPNINEKKSINFKAACKEVRKIFLENITLHLRSDVPLGVALSGGIDSSAIVCAIRKLQPKIPIHTFSYISEDSSKSEEKWINLVNTHVNAISHKAYAKPKNLLLDLEDLIKSQGEPFGSTSIYAHYQVLKLAKKNNIKVILEGQGADELLAGYSGYPGNRMKSLFDNGSILKALKFIYHWSRYPGRSYISGWKQFLSVILSNFIYPSVYRIFNNSTSNCLNIKLFKKQKSITKRFKNTPKTRFKNRRVIEKLLDTISYYSLPSLLRHGDRNAMRFSIENRTPFLTTSFAEYLYQLPENFLISDQGESKYIFREAMKDILPNKIKERKDKVGFEPGDTHWEKYYESEIIKNYNIISNSINLEIFHNNFLKKILKLDIKAKWRLLNFLIWLRLFSSELEL